VNLLVDTLLATLFAVLLAVTAAAALQYYRLIHKAREEYEKAREAVEDVVLSFNRELKRETEKLDFIAYRIEGNNSKIESCGKDLINLEKKISPIEERLGAASRESLSELSKLADVRNKITIVEETNSKLKTQITDLEGQIQKLLTLPEIRTESVIPIRRDKAMSALTNTEIAVLEYLSTEGSKTAPEIKEKVQLSREHTARLMKKLYEEGYLERETGKTPFRYSVKKEMEKLLSKPEGSPQPTSL